MAFREEDGGIKEHQKDGCLKDALDIQSEHLRSKNRGPRSSVQMCGSVRLCIHNNCA